MTVTVPWTDATGPSQRHPESTEAARQAPTYLRVLLTSRCPLSCPYCHQEGGLHGPGELSLEQLTDLVIAFVGRGFRKVKLLGGEPLVVRGLPDMISRIKEANPAVDLSMITSGVVQPSRMALALDAGLDRANVTVHGWSIAQLRRRGGTHRHLRNREATIALLMERGMTPKLNYVYTGPQDDQDLAGLLRWAAARDVVIGLLDDLRDPDAGPEVLEAAMERLVGRWLLSWTDDDPDSLPTTRYAWPDGLVVEIKSSSLGRLRPWTHCESCPVRDRGLCREGIYALRLERTGVVRLCMDRPDLSLDVRATPPEEATARCMAWVEEVLR